MAKKPTRSGKPQPGGRVTPKGVRPAGESNSHKAHDSRGAQPPAAAARKLDPSHGRTGASQHAPTRAGHHRGQR